MFEKKGVEVGGVVGEDGLDDGKKGREREGGGLFVDNCGFVVVKKVISSGFFSKFFSNFLDNRKQDIFFGQFYCGMRKKSEKEEEKKDHKKTLPFLIYWEKKENT